MNVLLEIVLELLSWLVPWPGQEKRGSLMGESELERSSKRLAHWVVFGLVLIGIGVALWWHLGK